MTCVILFFAFAENTAASSPPVDTLSRSNYKLSHQRFLYKGWLYHAGDDSAYAMTTMNDTSWQLMPLSPMSFMENGLPTKDFNGIGWFRFHFYLDSSLANDTLGFYLEVFGAADVYLDGKFLASYGKTGKSAGEEICGYSYEPRIIIIAPLSTGNHLLALRYSNFNGASKHLLNKNYSPRFIPAISKYKRDRELTKLYWDHMPSLLLSGIFLAFSALHIVLFFYYKRERANFYYGLFALGFALYFFITYLQDSGTNMVWSNILSALSTGIVVPFCLLTMIRLLSNIFHKKSTIAYYSVLVLALLYNPMSWFDFNFNSELLLILVVVGIAEILRLIVMAIIEKKEGSRIFGFGLLFFPACLVVTLFTVAILQNLNNNSWKTNFMDELLSFMFYGSILGISFAMTIYLARDFSKINRKLAAQLQEIKSLFNRTVDQEKEKKKILEDQKTELEQQVKVRTAELEQKNRDILDNLHYARRIQAAILPETSQIFHILKDAFILYLPKDIVSGDFYTFSQRDGKVIFAAADCTGHGVTGAFMSMIGSSLLNQIVNERGITQPARILNHLNAGIIEALKQNPSEVNDGMDIAICTIDLSENILHYAGANRPLWLIRNGDWSEIKADKMAIGGFRIQDDTSFSNHEMKLHKNDTVYFFSDGYADQFGGEEGKKMLSKRFRDKLLSIQHTSMRDQEKELLNYFKEWKGQHDQVDDVLVIGVRF